MLETEIIVSPAFTLLINFNFSSRGLKKSMSYFLTDEEFQEVDYIGDED